MGLMREVTVGAVTIDKRDMVDHAKGGRNKFFQVLKTTLELKQLLALQAVKMMVMGFSAGLVARWCARHLYRDQPSFIEQAFYGSIHRRHA